MSVVYLVCAAVGIIVIYLVLRARSASGQLAAPPEPKLPKGRARPKQKRATRDAAARAKAPVVAETEDEDEEIPVSSADEAAEIPEPSPPPAPLSHRKKDVKGLRLGLTKVRQAGGLFGRLKELLGGVKQIDPAIIDEMEEILVSSDVGVKTTTALLEQVRAELDRGQLSDADQVWTALRQRAIELLDQGGGALRNHGAPTVVLMVGVNGTGKTTTIGKLATKLVEHDRSVLLVAGDTFRAAAVAQLEAWGKRVGCEVFAGKDGADPAAVTFDAVKQAVESKVDVVLVDTAGRLHTKTNLMDELKKIARTTDKALPGAPHEVLLVLDGTTGQNAVQQAEMFSEAMDLTGIVLTKLDGTAKGGVVLAIAAEHELPVRYIGVGERAQDLRDFDPEEFVEAMLGASDGSAQAA